MRTLHECKKHLRSMGFKLTEVKENQFIFTCKKALDTIVATLVENADGTANYDVSIINHYDVNLIRK